MYNYYLNLRNYNNPFNEPQLEQELFYIFGNDNPDRPVTLCKEFTGLYLSCKSKLVRTTPRSNKFEVIKELDTLHDRFDLAGFYDSRAAFIDKVFIFELHFKVLTVDTKPLVDSIDLTVLTNSDTLNTYCYDDRQKSIITLHKQGELTLPIKVTAKTVNLSELQGFESNIIQPQFTNV